MSIEEDLAKIIAEWDEKGEVYTEEELRVFALETLKWIYTEEELRDLLKEL